MSPIGLTLGDLYWMAMGKAELMGMTAAGPDESVLEYNPATLASWG